MTTSIMTRHPVAPAGWLCIAGALLGIAGGLYTGFVPADVPVDRYSYPYATTGFIASQLVFAVHHLLQLSGVLGLYWAAPATGRMWRAAMRVATAGMVLLTACELWGLAYVHAAADAAGPGYLGAGYGLASISIGIGLTLAGVAVARAGRWVDWRRWTPLACGVAVFVIVLPGVFGSFLAGRLAITVWMLGWAALGAALVKDARHG